MALPITVPYTFGNATTAIPLSNLDSDYATVYQAVNGIGNGSVALANVAITGGTISGNTTASNVTVSSGTFTNVTLSNVTISSVSTPITAAEGGTGSSSAFTTNGVAYATSTSALATGSALTFDGTTFSNIAGGGQFNNLVKISNTANPYLQLYDGTRSGYLQIISGALNLIQTTAQPITFSTNNTEKMRLDSSGNLLINATSNAAQAAKLYVSGTTSTLAMFGDAYSTTVGDSRTILIGNTNAIIGIVESSTNIGIKFQTWSSGASVPLYLSGAGNVGIGTSSPDQLLSVNGNIRIDGSANIYGNSANTSFVSLYGGGAYNAGAGIGLGGSSNSGNANTIIFTRGSYVESARIDSSGNLLINTTTRKSSERVSITVDGNAQEALVLNDTNSSGTHNAISLYRPSGYVGGLQTTSTSTSLITSSDQRLKTNIVDAPDGNIDGIKVRSFNWLVDGSHQEYGMIAQELLEVAPYAVYQPTNPDEMMGVDYSKLVPMMIKEIQSLKQRIATLESK